MCKLDGKDAIEFYDFKKSDAFVPFLIDQITSGPILALILVGENARECWRQIIGPMDPAEARRTAPNSLRALYGMDKAANGFHGSESKEIMDKSINFFFPSATTLKRRPPLSTAQ